MLLSVILCLLCLHAASFWSFDNLCALSVLHSPRLLSSLYVFFCLWVAVACTAPEGTYRLLSCSLQNVVVHGSPQLSTFCLSLQCFVYYDVSFLLWFSFLYPFAVWTVGDTFSNHSSKALTNSTKYTCSFQMSDKTKNGLLLLYLGWCCMIFTFRPY